MSFPAISVANLSKKYKIGTPQFGAYRSLREEITHTVTAPFRSLLSRNGHEEVRRSTQKVKQSTDTIWALKDVSFEVKPGEVVGIIGRNGAGKSTLLKILSRITEPFSGRVEIHGRVCSLLEVGTGFHPELTGRENIYLNGAILGMSHRELKNRFDEIVAFSEIERFLDTPVKRYSSGMYVRLAFAVAAHLLPEILVVDEVLAVGDAAFQKKCLNKMQDIGHTGRTVLFVSHNMPAVTRLCSRVVLLNEGQVSSDGPAQVVTSEYLRSGLNTNGCREWSDVTKAPGDDIVRLRALSVCTEEDQLSDAFDIRRPIGIKMEFDVQKPGHVLIPAFGFLNEDGVYIFHLADLDWKRKERDVGRYTSTAWIPGNILAEGSVIVGAGIGKDRIVHFWVRDAVAFQVVDTLDGDSARGDYAGPYPGVVRPIVPWTTLFVPPS